MTANGHQPPPTSRYTLDEIRLVRGTCHHIESLSLHNILGNRGSAGCSWQMLFALLPGGVPQISLRKDMVTNGSNPRQDLLSLVSPRVLIVRTWHQVSVTMTWGADRCHPCCRLFVDGQEVAAVSPIIEHEPGLRSSRQLLPTRNPYIIGRKQDSGDAGSWLDGKLRDCWIYTAALDPGAIAERASTTLERLRWEARKDER